MAVIQCKMCGANLKMTFGTRVVVCEYCGTSQTPFEEMPQAWAGGSEETFLQRAFLALEDGNWGKADEFCEQVLNANPENAWAYLGKLLAELGLTDKEMLKTAPYFGHSKNYKRLMQFADKSQERDLLTFMQEIIEYRRIMHYELALKQMENANHASGYENAIKNFQYADGYKDSLQKIKECQILKEEAKKLKIYNEANFLFVHASSIQTLQAAEDMFRSLNGWRDSNAKIAECEWRKKKLKRTQLIHFTFWMTVAGLVMLATYLFIRSA